MEVLAYEFPDRLIELARVFYPAQLAPVSHIRNLPGIFE